MYPHERSLVNRLKDKPFVLLGINSDDDEKLVRDLIKKGELTWPFWFDGQGPGGPIPTAWNVTGWPAIYVLDHKGIIRYKDVRGDQLDAAVDKLLAELEKEKAAN